MFKKLFVTAAAAAAVSVPLAGAALADSGGDPNGNGLGQGGMPQTIGNFAATGVDPALPNPNGRPRTPRFLPARNSISQRTIPPL